MALINEVLQSLGFEETEIADIVAEKEGLVLSDLTAKASTVLSNKLLDDPAFISLISRDKLSGTDVFKSIFAEGQSKSAAMLLKDFKESFGIEDGDLTEEQRKQFIKNAAPLVKDKFSKLKMDDIAKVLEAENTTLKGKVAELEGAGGTLREKLESEFAEKLSVREQDFAAQRLMLPFAENLKFGLTGSMAEAIANVRAKFTVTANNGTIELKDKTNVSFSAKIDGKVVTYQEALIAEVKAFGAWVEPKKEEAGKQHVKIAIDGDKGVTNSTGFSQADIDKMIAENN